MFLPSCVYYTTFHHLVGNPAAAGVGLATPGGGGYYNRRVVEYEIEGVFI